MSRYGIAPASVPRNPGLPPEGCAHEPVDEYIARVSCCRNSAMHHRFLWEHTNIQDSMLCLMCLAIDIHAGEDNGFPVLRSMPRVQGTRSVARVSNGILVVQLPVGVSQLLTSTSGAPFRSIEENPPLFSCPDGKMSFLHFLPGGKSRKVKIRVHI